MSVIPHADFINSAMQPRVYKDVWKVNNLTWSQTHTITPIMKVKSCTEQLRNRSYGLWFSVYKIFFKKKKNRTRHNKLYLNERPTSILCICKS